MISAGAGRGRPLAADAKPIALRKAVAQVAPEVSRMASRFSQLAALGAADCLRRLHGADAGHVGPSQPALAPDTRIYLATGLGDIAHTDALYFGVMSPKSEMPPPARFATSGNNMAAFFVAQHAGLASRNLTVSQAELSFESALELALSDLAAGAMSAALVGSADETTLPREFYTRRFDVGADQMIGEGSGWLLLDTAPRRDSGAAVGAIIDARVLPSRGTRDAARLVDQVWPLIARIVCAPMSSPIVLLAGTGIPADEMIELQREADARAAGIVSEDYLRWTGRFPTAVAVVMAAMLSSGAQHGQKRTCVHLNRDPQGRTGLVAFEMCPVAG